MTSGKLSKREFKRIKREISSDIFVIIGVFSFIFIVAILASMIASNFQTIACYLCNCRADCGLIKELFPNLTNTLLVFLYPLIVVFIIALLGNSMTNEDGGED